MDIAVILLIAVAAVLVYGIHGIVLLRWCGQWSQSRRLVLWISQMCFPFTTGLLGAWLGEELMWWVFGAPVVVPSRAGPGVVAAVAPLSFTPSFLLLTVAFILGPALVIRGRWRALASAMAGVVTAWAGGAAAVYATANLSVASFVAILAWHLGALGAPLLFAWRVRGKRKRALGGRACLDCGYDLAGVTLHRCPECGAKRKELPEDDEAPRPEVE